MKESFQEEYFESYGDDAQRTASYKEQIVWISKFLPIKNSRVLDYGCGTGEMMKLLNSQGALTLGCDISSFAINKCKQIGLDCELIVNDKVPYEEQFDLIIVRGVFQHLWSPNDVFRELFSLLKPGGFVAILSTPNVESWCYRIFGDIPTITKSLNMNLPSKTSLKHCLKVNGFVKVVHRYPYLNSGYAKPIADLLKFFLKLFRLSNTVPTFPGNVIEMIGKKC